MDKPQIEYPVILAGRRPKTLAELFSSPLRWTKGANGKTAQEDHVHERHPGAVRWCIGGGIALVYSEGERYAVFEKLLAIINKEATEDDEPQDSVVSWNDNPKTTFKDIRQTIVKANV